MRHIEISIEATCLRYQPGDALGVWYQNDPALVKELVGVAVAEGRWLVTVDGKTPPLAEALEWH